MANPYLIPGLRLAPPSVLSIVGAVDASRYDEKVDPERFSLREAVAHLADWEPIHVERIEAIAGHPGAVIRAYDEVERARTNRYGETDPMQEAERWIALRERTIAVIEGLPASAWSHEGTHPERGVMSVADLVHVILGHDIYHIEHLARYL